MPVGERKSGMPLSVEIPAPVSTMHGWRRRISLASLLSHGRRVTAHQRLPLQRPTSGPLRGDRRARHRAQLELPRLVRARPRCLPGGIHRRLPGTPRAQGIESLVLESHVRYLQPAHFDDRLAIHTRVSELRGPASASTTRSSATAKSSPTAGRRTPASTPPTLRPTRIPGWLAEAIAKAEAA